MILTRNFNGYVGLHVLARGSVTESTKTRAKATGRGGSASASPTLANWYGEDRAKIFPGLIPPSHLKGEYPGDYGWDWAGLCTNPERFAFLRQAEIMNGRWAMLGALGCLVPEFLVNQGVEIFGDGIWFKTNAAALTQEGATLLGFGIGNNGSNVTLQFVATFLSLGPVEVWRYNGSGGGFEGPYDTSYPGWDPLGLTEDPDTFAELKVKEVKHARLAMAGFLGFLLQAVVTGKGPLENLADHLADPTRNNAVINIASRNADKILS